MNPNITVTLDRANELFADLKKEYEQSLRNQTVSGRATQLTHDILEKLRSVLDRLVRLYWEAKVAPNLPEDERKRAVIYFPIADDENSFNSIIGRWRLKGIESQHETLIDYLRGVQPYCHPQNKWLKTLNSLAVHGKHIDLVPQTRFEQRMKTVTRGSASLSWSPNVKFSAGVKLLGAPIDPRTQNIVPDATIIQKEEIWVSFILQNYGVDALGFCEHACSAVRIITEEMSQNFSL
jgi:hypothetical protein